LTVAALMMCETLPLVLAPVAVAVTFTVTVPVLPAAIVPFVNVMEPAPTTGV